MPDDTPLQNGISARRLMPLGLLVAAGIAFVVVGGHRYLTFAALADNRNWLCGLVARWGIVAALIYILAYAVPVALSVPGGAVLTIAGGFLFGTWLGGLCAVVGATLGATAVFLAARAGLGGLAQRAGPLIGKLEAGFRADAFNYLLVLRLVPLVSVLAGQPRPGVGSASGCRPTCSRPFSASFPAPSSMPASATGSAASSSEPDLGILHFARACCCRSSALPCWPWSRCGTNAGAP